MCRDFEETCCFDMFGNIQNFNAGVSSCDNWQEVDVISLVGVGSSSCEMLYNGSKTLMDKPLMDNVSVLRKESGYIGTIFNVPHEDNLGKYSQILFVYKKGNMPKERIDRIFPNRAWNKLV